jgi:hypothetical protein
VRPGLELVLSVAEEVGNLKKQTRIRFNFVAQ